MSSKTGKRRGRRLNTNDDDQKKDDVEIIDDNQSNVSTDTEKTEKDTSLKEIKDSPVKENEVKDVEVKENKENGENEEKKIENGDDEQKTNGDHHSNDQQNIIEECSDIEPLVLDAEEQELQFVSESEASEIDKSPIINRCKTRRSLTRNLPTPKTPKTLEECPPIINIPKIDEEKSELNDTISVESSFSEQTQESDMTNASVFVHLSDTTRNVDITTMDDSTLNASNFLDSTKDKSYGETLRCISGRKTLRSTHPRFFNSAIDLTDSSGKYSTLRTGVKRKLEEDDKSSFLSYLSPFKKIHKSELPSSTPKLTGYKIGQHEIVENSQEKSKKWCSIM